MPSNDNSRAIEVKIETIDIHYEEMKQKLEKFETQELKTVQFIKYLAVVVGLMSFVITGYNTIQNDRAIDRTDKRISELSGNFRPDYAIVHGIRGVNDKHIVMAARVERYNSDGIQLYQAALRGNVIVRPSGGPGKVLGFSSTTSGELLDFASRQLDGTISELLKDTNTLGFLSIERGGEGTMATETSPLPIQVGRFGTFKTCEEAEAEIVRMMGLGANVGKIGIIPKFSNIKNPADHHEVFTVSLIKGSYLDCGTRDKMIKEQAKVKP